MEKDILVFQDHSYSRESLQRILPGVSEQLTERSYNKQIAILTNDLHQLTLMLLGSLFTDLTVFLLHPNIAEKKLDDLKSKKVPIVHQVQILQHCINDTGMPVAGNENFWVFSTSNTTSAKSHWVRIPARVLIFKAQRIGEILGLNEDDVTCLLSPLCFIQSVWVLLAHLHANATVIVNRFSVEVLKKTFSEKRITTFITVPSIVRTMLDELEDVGSLRLLGVGGDYSDELTIGRLVKKWPELYFSNIYGCTETSAADLILAPKLLKNNERELYSLGKPSGFSRVEIHDVESGRLADCGEDGVIYISGRYVTDFYYWEDEEKIIGEYGFRTEDIAQKDENGYFYFKGRSVGLIKCNGNKMSSIEIEQAVESLPGIYEAAVFGIRDELYGQIPVCIYSGTREYTRQEFLQELTPVLEKYKIPRRFFLSASLPHTVSGKKSRNIDEYRIEDYIESQ